MIKFRHSHRGGARESAKYGPRTEDDWAQRIQRSHPHHHCHREQCFHYHGNHHYQQHQIWRGGPPVGHRITAIITINNKMRVITMSTLQCKLGRMLIQWVTERRQVGHNRATPPPAILLSSLLRIQDDAINNGVSGLMLWGETSGLAFDNPWGPGRSSNPATHREPLKTS